jgi:hypothetical protein
MPREIYKYDATLSDVREVRNYTQTYKKCFGCGLSLQANFLFGLK